MLEELEHMLVLVTGGCGGIGSAVCQRLKEGGHRAITLDMVPNQDRTVPDIVVDMATVGQTGQAVKDASRKFGAFDAIVNCVGYYRFRKLDEFSWNEYEHYMQVNTRAPIEAILAWLTCRSQNRRGVAVNISSAGATTASRDLAYATSKAALEGATRSLARSLALDNILVFGIAPGIIDTNMSRAMPVQRFQEHASATLLKRAGNADEIADLVFFLISGKSDYMIGTIINVSCGLMP